MAFSCWARQHFAILVLRYYLDLGWVVEISQISQICISPPIRKISIDF